MTDQNRYNPGDVFRDMEKSRVASRKDRFRSINADITEGGGWTTSVPGEREVRFEVLPGSPLPNALRARGYDVQVDGVGERILPASKVEWLVRGSDGSFDLATPGSTKTPAARVSHAGIYQVEKFYFNLT